jgi:hypothetical protein
LLGGKTHRLVSFYSLVDHLTPAAGFGALVLTFSHHMRAFSGRLVAS